MSQIRWGMIGCGDIAQRCVGPALTSLSTCELVAVSRREPSALQSCVNQFGAQKGYENWQDLCADDSIQAVYLASPVHLHGEQAVKAAECGKHVLCEKPLALDSGEGKAMIDAADQNGVHLGVAYYRHFFPVVLRMKEILAAGEIGDVMQIRIDAAETPLFSKDHPRYWIFEKEKAGGGCLMDFGCHRIEVLLYLQGEIARVKASTAKVYDRHDVEDAATLLLEFGSGAHGVLSVMRGGNRRPRYGHHPGNQGLRSREYAEPGRDYDCHRGWKPHRNLGAPQQFSPSDDRRLHPIPAGGQGTGSRRPNRPAGAGDRRRGVPFGSFPVACPSVRRAYIDW